MSDSPAYLGPDFRSKEYRSMYVAADRDRVWGRLDLSRFDAIPFIEFAATKGFVSQIGCGPDFPLPPDKFILR